MKLRKDYLLIDNHIKKCYYQKKAWRQIKSKMTGEMFSIDKPTASTQEASSNGGDQNSGEKNINEYSSKSLVPPPIT